MSLVSDVKAQVRQFLPEIIEFRRDLHQHPEVSWEERRTAERVAARLRQAGLPLRTGVGGHGVIALIGEGEPCFALRADMDALPIQEQTGLPWASQTPGVMHACGHDFHTAWLLGAGLVLQALGLPRGSVKLIFQPAEETLFGAPAIIREGALAEPEVAAVCAAHVWPEYPAGQVALRPGPNLAAADKFTIQINGAGTHGASPHLGRDPIPAAAELVLALQTLVSRRLDPLQSAVVSVCQVHAGTAFNVVPPMAMLQGTVRTLREEHRGMLETAIVGMATGIAQAHRCRAETIYERGVPPTVTDPGMTALAQRTAVEAMGADQVVEQSQGSMGGEDFSYFLEQRPGALLWVGCASTPEAAKTMSLHHSEFVGSEDCLEPAMTVLALTARRYLEKAAAGGEE